MNEEMSTIKENVIWEEKNLAEPPKKSESNGESVECVITTSTKEKLENKILNDTTKISGS